MMEAGTELMGRLERAGILAELAERERRELVTKRRELLARQAEARIKTAEDLRNAEAAAAAARSHLERLRPGFEAAARAAEHAEHAEIRARGAAEDATEGYRRALRACAPPELCELLANLPHAAAAARAAFRSHETMRPTIVGAVREVGTNGGEVEAAADAIRRAAVEAERLAEQSDLADLPARLAAIRRDLAQPLRTLGIDVP